MKNIKKSKNEEMNKKREKIEILSKKKDTKKTGGKKKEEKNGKSAQICSPPRDGPKNWFFT